MKEKESNGTELRLWEYTWELTYKLTYKSAEKEYNRYRVGTATHLSKEKRSLAHIIHKVRFQMQQEAQCRIIKPYRHVIHKGERGRANKPL